MYNHANIPPKQTEIVEVKRVMTSEEIDKKLQLISCEDEYIEFVNTLSDEEIDTLNNLVRLRAKSKIDKINERVEHLDGLIKETNDFIEQMENFISGFSK